MGVFFNDLKKICTGRIRHFQDERLITHLLIDSRKLVNYRGAIFFAIEGTQHDGHDFIAEVFRKGIRQFIVAKQDAVYKDVMQESNVLEVTNVIDAIQAITGDHRRQYQIPVIAITGSNGKTIVKEWLSQLLGMTHKVVKSPKSYNSQVGVPLSVWQITDSDEFGIFEAGISQSGEMDNLEKVIQPTIGILTNLGPAHDQGFKSMEDKAEEKLKLFRHCNKVIYCCDHERVVVAIEKFKKTNPGVECISWSLSGRDSNYNFSVDTNYIAWNGIELAFKFPDYTSQENLIHCIVTYLELGMNLNSLQQAVSLLEPVNMRLELKRGINGCYLIDDSYNNDLASLEIALDFMAQQGGQRKKTLILSDILQANRNKEELYGAVSDLLGERGVDELIGIGAEISSQKETFQIKSTFYPETRAFINALSAHQFDNKSLLIKGARPFAFEQIVNQLQEKIHGTRLEVDINALTENLNYYRSLIIPGCCLMVMVKALAYGGGSYEIANVLQYHRVDYLAVAYVDEGIELRKKGITLPIMVMNVSHESFIHLNSYNLEPEIYSVSQLNRFIGAFEGLKMPMIHLKIDSGMHRLGFSNNDIDDLIAILKGHPGIDVASIFTHLSASEDEGKDNFTILQVESYQAVYDKIGSAINRQPLKHVLNSSGISRFPKYHLDMVRLGIGLYGIDPDPEMQEHLQEVSTLKTSISQIKEIERGESVGYGRAFVAQKPTTIATLAIGYADGYDRRFGNGVGKVIVDGKMAKVVGNICMDMTMVDVTGIDAREGDEVIVFGTELSVKSLADSIGTIPYEILTNVGNRVKRVFHIS